MFQLDTDEGHHQWIRHLIEERDRCQGNKFVPTYVTLLPYYSTSTILQWHKENHINAEIDKYSFISNESLNYSADLPFSKKLINRHYFECQCYTP